MFLLAPLLAAGACTTEDLDMWANGLSMAAADLDAQVNAPCPVGLYRQYVPETVPVAGYSPTRQTPMPRSDTRPTRSARAIPTAPPRSLRMTIVMDEAMAAMAGVMTATTTIVMAIATVTAMASATTATSLTLPLALGSAPHMGVKA